MVSRRTAATLWLVAGLSSAFLVPYMTDQVLLAVFAIGAIVGIVLAAACLLRWGERLARWSAATGAVWLVAFVHDPFRRSPLPRQTVDALLDALAASIVRASPEVARQAAALRVRAPRATALRRAGCRPARGVAGPVHSAG